MSSKAKIFLFNKFQLLDMYKCDVHIQQLNLDVSLRIHDHISNVSLSCSVCNSSLEFNSLNRPSGRAFGVFWKGLDLVWMFGGVGFGDLVCTSFDLDAKALNDLWVLNTTSFQWKWLRKISGLDGDGQPAGVYGTRYSGDASVIPYGVNGPLAVNIETVGGIGETALIFGGVKKE